MAHCPFNKLSDISDVLEEVRELEKLKEPKVGIFYLKSKGFLHFHEKDGRRWADVREGASWGDEIDLPFNATKTLKRAFLNEVKKRYQTTLEC